MSGGYFNDVLLNKNFPINQKPSIKNDPRKEYNDVQDRKKRQAQDSGNSPVIEQDNNEVRPQLPEPVNTPTDTGGQVADRGLGVRRTGEGKPRKKRVYKRANRKDDGGS